MVRFILITFLFLGFAFYQMSGGASFDPVETRMSRIDAPEDATIVVAENSSTPVRVTTAPVERVSLELANLQDVVRVKPALQTVSARQRPEPAQTQVAQVVAAEPEPALILPSLIPGASTAQVTPVDFSEEPVRRPVAEQRDIRAVSGNSVNMRGGPGTSFGVVNKLSRGDQVVVLEDPGQGWVRLRPVDGGPVGWMADFLLEEG